MSLDSTKRFSDRVNDYVQFRPGYPQEAIELLKNKFSLSSSSIIADIGSGTGISAEMFLRENCTVFGVEPNDEMRAAAEKVLSQYKKFHSVKGTSDKTNLQNQSVDFVVAAQAFHWFEPISTKKEFKRILKDQGYIVIIFNDRKITGSAFAEGYENLMNEFGSDYKQVKHQNVSEKRHREFLGDYQQFNFENFQEFDFNGLLGRITSSSYAPNKDHPRFNEMKAAFKNLFEQTQTMGKVKMDYITQVFCARKPQ
jgi:ubiquinone/menaquinone biosynthesis C-methylase UbiE